jgi:hypothetical protein
VGDGYLGLICDILGPKCDMLAELLAAGTLSSLTACSDGFTPSYTASSLLDEARTSP